MELSSGEFCEIKTYISIVMAHNRALNTRTTVFKSVLFSKLINSSDTEYVIATLLKLLALKI